MDEHTVKLLMQTIAHYQKTISDDWGWIRPEKSVAELTGDQRDATEVWSDTKWQQGREEAAADLHTIFGQIYKEVVKSNLNLVTVTYDEVEADA